MKPFVLVRAALLLTAIILTGCFSSAATPRPTPPRGATDPVDNVAIVFVIHGLGLWMGNDEYAGESEDVYPGAFRSVVAAVDATVAELPSRSKLALITYHYNHELRLPLRRPTPAASAFLGTQQDYESGTSSDLARGVEAGLRLLVPARATRKVLLVIGDGHDTDPDRTRDELTAMRSTVDRHGIEVFAAVLRSALSGDHPLDVTLVADHVVYVDAPATLVDHVRAIVRQVTRAPRP